jgi:aerobic carbon-monoxide dehydrogenase medium subunit
VKPAPFDYALARTAQDAVEALGRHRDDAKVLAGGQSLVPMLNMRLSRPAVVVDINQAKELDYLRASDGILTVGALTRQRALERWAATSCPLIAEALRWVGHAAIRNRGTVAGSIAHGDPASELPALLLCLDGAVVARGPGGERVIPASQLYVAPLSTTLRPDELITEVRFTLPRPGAGWGFAEVARRQGDFALVGAAALLWRENDGRVAGARLSFFGVGGTPQRSLEAEAALMGHEPTPSRLHEAARAAAARLSPDGDLHATAEYRRRVAGVLAERTLTAALGRCGAPA